MPRLPQVVQNQPLQGSGLSIGSAMAPAEAAARLGQEATNIGLELAHRQVELQRSQRVMEKTAQGAEAAAKLYDQILNDPSVPNDQIASRVQAGFKILHDNIGKDIKDPQVRQNYDENFQALTTQHVVHAIGVQRDRINSSAKAALDESNDTLSNLAVDQTGPQLDAVIGQLHGNIAGAVANKLLTPEQGKNELDKRLADIQDAKGLKLIRTNPQSAIDFYKSDEQLDPVHREIRLNQAIEQLDAQTRQARADQRFAEEQAQKLRNDAIENDSAQARLSALDGKLTHQALTELVQKYNQPGQKPFPAAETEHLFDLINKPLQQMPSDPNVLKSTELAVTSVIPRISKADLANLYRKGALNLDDYTALDNKLTTNLHYLADQSRSDMRMRQSQAEIVLHDFYVGHPEIHALAMKDMSEGSAAQGGTMDPWKLVPIIKERYKDAVESYGGVTTAKAINEFSAARGTYFNTLAAQRKWASGVRGTIADTLETNPSNELIQQRRDDLLNKAKVAKKILGPADPDIKDETAWIDNNGVHVIAVGGQVIGE